MAAGVIALLDPPALKQAVLLVRVSAASGPERVAGSRLSHAGHPESRWSPDLLNACNAPRRRIAGKLDLPLSLVWMAWLCRLLWSAPLEQIRRLLDRAVRSGGMSGLGD